MNNLLYITTSSISKLTINLLFPKYFCILYTVNLHLFWKDFKRNLPDSIEIPDTTKRNLNVHFILGNTGHDMHDVD